MPSTRNKLVSELPTARRRGTYRVGKLPQLIMVTSGVTRAQKDARVDDMLQEHGRLQSELQEQIQAVNSMTRVFFDELKWMYAHNQACFEEIRLTITTFTGKQTESARDSARILRSGFAIGRNVAGHNQSPAMTINQDREPHHAFRMGRVDFPNFNGNDVSSLLYQVEHYCEIDGTPKESKLNLVAIHLEGEALQWH